MSQIDKLGTIESKHFIMAFILLIIISLCPIINYLIKYKLSNDHMLNCNLLNIIFLIF